MATDSSTSAPAVTNSQAPNPQLPVIQKLRIRYSKRGRLRFTSHRDFGRAFERAVRRADVPIAFSSGFHPHPKISYAGASPTGAASEAEFLEIGLTRHCEPAQVAQRLDEALPVGFDILDVVVAGKGNLADRLEASHWRIELPGVGLADAQTAADQFLAAPEMLVERMTKKGLREFDSRAAVRVLSVEQGPQCAILDMVVRHGVPAVRPDDVLVGLRLCGLVTEIPPIAVRLAQGPFDEVANTVGDPLALDRDAPLQATTAAG